MHTMLDIHPDENAALNTRLAETYLGRNDTHFRLEQFNYADDALLDIIFRQMERTSFNGITVLL